MIHDTMEKKTTGATIILRAFMYIVLTGANRLVSSALLNVPGAAKVRISPITMAAIIALSVCQRNACLDFTSVTRI